MYIRPLTDSLLASSVHSFSIKQAEEERTIPLISIIHTTLSITKMNASTSLILVAVAFIATMTNGVPLSTQPEMVGPALKEEVVTREVPSQFFPFPKGTAFVQGAAGIGRGPQIGGQVVAPGTAFLAGGVANERSGAGLAVGGGKSGGRAQAAAEPGIGFGEVEIPAPTPDAY